MSITLTRYRRVNQNDSPQLIDFEIGIKQYVSFLNFLKPVN